MSAVKIGLIVNPVAGLGGAVGLKGSDGMAELALARGAVPRAAERAVRVLKALAPYQSSVALYVGAGEMGEAEARLAGWEPVAVIPAGSPSSAEDSRAVARQMLAARVDLILFAGGDGTARDMVDAVGTSIPVLGIPAGVKMHSGVFAVNPESAADLVAGMLQGQLVQVDEAEVRDIDESSFREGKVRTRHYGELRVPQEGRYLQHVKCSGREVEELVLADIVAGIIEDIQPGQLYIVGPGSTTKALFDELGLEKTLLGFDLLLDGECVAHDVDAAGLREWIAGREATLILTFIPGQGHLIGRGNQQLQPDILRAIGRDNLLVMGTHDKLKTLEGRPLLMDSGDVALDQEWAGAIEIVTGYRHRVLYRLDFHG